MRYHIARAAVAAALLAPSLHGQGLAARIDGAAPGAVVFSFPARPGVCGNGRSFIQSTNGFYGNYYSGTYVTNGNGDVMRTEACQTFLPLGSGARETSSAPKAFWYHSIALSQPSIASCGVMVCMPSGTAFAMIHLQG